MTVIFSLMSEPPLLHSILEGIGGPHRTPLLLADVSASRSLVGIVAILTFLGALAAGAADIVAAGSADWRSTIAREATVQLRPLAGRDTEADLERIAAIARATPGISDARPVSRAGAESLLEPWLGRGLDLASLPVPRIVTLKLATEPRFEQSALATAIAAEIPGATIDDHGRWLSRLAALADTIVATALGLVVVVLSGCCLAVGFATRGAMAGSREAVEVLHLVGAGDRFIAKQFASRMLRLGAGAAALGAGAAALAILCLQWLTGMSGTDGGPEVHPDAFLGAFALGGRALMLLIVVAIGVVLLIGLVSTWTATRFLRELRASP